MPGGCSETEGGGGEGGRVVSLLVVELLTNFLQAAGVDGGRAGAGESVTQCVSSGQQLQ